MTDKKPSVYFLLELFEDAVYHLDKNATEDRLLSALTYNGILGKLQAARDLVVASATCARDNYWRNGVEDKENVADHIRVECERTRRVLQHLIDDLQNSTMKLGMIIEQCAEFEESLKKSERKNDGRRTR